MPRRNGKVPKTALKPLADNVVIRPLKESAEKKGSLFIPDTAKEKPQVGEVIAVGPGRFEEGEKVPMQLVVGDRVLFGKYSGTEVVLGDHKCLIMKESDVLAVTG